MKQVLIQKGHVYVEDVPAPTIDENSVLVRVAFSLISVGTERAGVESSGEPLIRKALKHPEEIKKVVKAFQSKGLMDTFSLIKGRLENKTPIGYSCSGIVLSAGTNVQGVVPGDLVACAGGGKAYHAEIVSIPKNLVVKIPQGCELQDAASVALGSIAMQGIRRADVRIGENIAVVGLGLVGQLSVQMLRIAGCRTIGFDIDPDRIKLAEALGMDRGVLADGQDIIKAVQEFTSGREVDATIITASSKQSDIVQQAMEITRKKGKIVVVGDVGLNLKRHPFYEKELDFLISTSYGPGRYDEEYENRCIDYPYSYVRWTEQRNMEAYLALLAQRKLDFRKLTSKVYDIQDAPEAYQELLRDQSRPLCTILSYKIKDHNDNTTQKESQFDRKLVLNPKGLSSEKIRVGIIGAGSFAQATHLPNLRKLSNLFSIAAITNKNGVMASNVAKRYGAIYATTDYKEILNDAEIDMVIISTRHNLHAQIAMEALETGKAVLVEKPMAMSVPELDQVVRKVTNSAAQFMVGFNRRFSPFAEKAKQSLNNRTNPLIINYRVNAGYIPSTHWTQREEGGGRVIGEACHMFDLFNYFTDSSVKCIAANGITPSSDALLKSDNFIATVKYNDGSLCSLLYTSMGNDKIGKESLEIYCGGKVIVIDDFKKMTIFGSKKEPFQSRKIEKGHIEELIAFSECLKKRTEGPIDLDHLIAATKTSIIVNEILNGSVQC